MISHSQQGGELAVSIITQHFGDLVGKVCGCLVKKGTLTLQEVCRFAGLQVAQVKNCLLVLIQHNCVQAFSTEAQAKFGEAPKIITKYMALFDNVLHRMRFPKFLALAAQLLDSECEALLEGLLEHGRLTLEKMMLRATKNQENTNIQDAVRASFVKLVHARFVERCPTSEPFLMSDPEGAPKAKRGAKSVGDMETEEQRAIIAATPLESKRFSISLNDITSDANAREHLPSTMIGEKRKFEALDMDNETKATIDEKEVLWRANFEEFVRCLRNKACVANVRSRLDLGTGTVLEAMLEATRSAEKKVKIDSSVPVSMDTILHEVRRRHEGLAMTLDHVHSALDQLGCHSGTGGTEGAYSIDLRSIIEVAQNDEVESVVLKRYGREAYRIFRLLAKSGSLVETDRISDITLLEKMKTARILFKLWTDNYLHMEKVVAHGHRQSHFLLWKVNKRTLWEHVLNDMYHSALNLNKRLAYELEEEREVQQMPLDQMTAIQLDKRARVRRLKLLMIASLLKLDDALMLFHNF